MSPFELLGYSHRTTAPVVLLTVPLVSVRIVGNKVATPFCIAAIHIIPIHREAVTEVRRKLRGEGGGVVGLVMATASATPSTTAFADVLLGRREASRLLFS
jgi:hypothetical protein